MKIRKTASYMSVNCTEYDIPDDVLYVRYADYDPEDGLTDKIEQDIHDGEFEDYVTDEWDDDGDEETEYWQVD